MAADQGMTDYQAVKGALNSRWLCDLDMVNVYARVTPVINNLEQYGDQVRHLMAPHVPMPLRPSLPVPPHAHHCRGGRAGVKKQKKCGRWRALPSH